MGFASGNDADSAMCPVVSHLCPLSLPSRFAVNLCGGNARVAVRMSAPIDMWFKRRHGMSASTSDPQPVKQHKCPHGHVRGCSVARVRRLYTVVVLPHSIL